MVDVGGGSNRGSMRVVGQAYLVWLEFPLTFPKGQYSDRTGLVTVPGTPMDGSGKIYVALVDDDESLWEVREHWQGPYHFGAPDGVVVNVTKDKIWVREGIIPKFPNSRAPQFDFSTGQLVVPHPPTSRKEIQEPFVREHEIDPNLYYPKGYHPGLLPEWPVAGDLVVPIAIMPPQMLNSMGEAWRKKQENLEALKKETVTPK